MEAIRSFYPVGQGAFYGEYLPEYNFNIVYDCGSKNKLALNRCINSYHYVNKDIDILFISHFHEDHINGVEDLLKKCKVKRIIMPYMDINQKMLYIGALSGNSSSISIANFILDPDNTAIKYGCKVTYVNKTNFEGEDGREAPQINDPLELASKIASGTQILIPRVNETQKCQCKWVLVPSNIQIDINANKLADALSKSGIDVKNFSINNFSIDSLKKVYKEVFGKRKLNDTSLLLYSGCEYPLQTCYCYCHFECEMPPFDDLGLLHHRYHYYHCLDCPTYEIRRPGCLYMGDITLSKENVKIIDKYYNRYYSNLSFVQVPHHGSRTSLNDSFWAQFPGRYAILSFGIPNHFCHPSTEVLNMLDNQDLCPLYISDRISSVESLFVICR